MKKILLGLLLTTVLTFSLTGCNNQSSLPSPSITNTSKPTETKETTPVIEKLEYIKMEDVPLDLTYQEAIERGFCVWAEDEQKTDESIIKKFVYDIINKDQAQVVLWDQETSINPKNIIVRIISLENNQLKVISRENDKEINEDVYIGLKKFIDGSYYFLKDMNITKEEIHAGYVSAQSGATDNFLYFHSEKTDKTPKENTYINPSINLKIGLYEEEISNYMILPNKWDSAYFDRMTYLDMTSAKSKNLESFSYIPKDSIITFNFGENGPNKIDIKQDFIVSLTELPINIEAEALKANYDGNICEIIVDYNGKPAMFLVLVCGWDNGNELEIVIPCKN